MNSSLKTVLALNIFILLVGLTPLYKPVSFGFRRLSTPFEAKLNGLNSNLLTGVDFLVSLPKIYGQNAELKNELVKYRQLEANYFAAVNENDLLRPQLATPFPKKSSKTVPALVLGRNSSEGLVTLGAGKVDGVGIGNLVTIKGVLLGKIESTDDHRSQLLLTVSPQSRFEAVTSNLLSRGEVVGNFGNRLSFTKVLPSQPLNVGDIVLDFGSRLILGKVEKVQSEGAKIFKEADVAVLYDPSFLTEVFVVIE